MRSLSAPDGGPWHGPAVAAPAGSSRPGTPIGLAHRTCAGQVDAAYAGADGSIQVMWSVLARGWHPPTAVAPPGTCAPGTAVTLGHQRTRDQLDALCTGADGSVLALWAAADGPWSGPAVLAPPGTCAPGTPVGLGRRGPAERLEAVYAGLDGSVRTLWADVDHPWQGPAVLAPPGTCARGTAVTLASQDDAGRLTALFTGADGSVQVMWADGAGPWHGPEAVAPAGHCAPGSPVAVAYGKSAERLDAVVAGVDGSVLALSAAGEAGWHGPVTAAPPGTCTPGTGIGLGHRAVDLLNAVFADADGALHTIVTLRDGGWRQPVEIAPPGSAAPGSAVALTHRGPIAHA
ncbi:hypothetical protein O7599_03235 [Streptomyces sp. WMMC500]|uniref:hypothetical protein n=1 Tax=Streptomyces sp. WMMC500 TaxID=3015154 RepID=UPI00248CD081|nr:hypothetical protein [Streptomyces sp. WMMC500]WBB61584.1 hypothetical protein O7599_03235 [Streptomyces sp. WMMC500]